MTRSEVLGKLSETEWKVWVMLHKQLITDGDPPSFMARLKNSFVFLKARVMLGGVDPACFAALTTACIELPENKFSYSDCYNWLNSLRLF